MCTQSKHAKRQQQGEQLPLHAHCTHSLGASGSASSPCPGPQSHNRQPPPIHPPTHPAPTHLVRSSRSLKAPRRRFSSALCSSFSCRAGRQAGNGNRRGSRNRAGGAGQGRAGGASHSDTEAGHSCWRDCLPGRAGWLAAPPSPPVHTNFAKCQLQNARPLRQPHPPTHPPASPSRPASPQTAPRAPCRCQQPAGGEVSGGCWHVHTDAGAAGHRECASPPGPGHKQYQHQ